MNLGKKNIIIHLLEASKPPEGTGVVVPGSCADGTIGTAAGTGGAGEPREPRASKLDSRRLFCSGAKAGARAGAAVGARVGDIRPEGDNTQDCAMQHCFLTQPHSTGNASKYD